WAVLLDELGEMPTREAAAAEAQHTLALPGRATAILDGDGRALAANWSGLQLPEPAPRGSDGDRVWTMAGRSGPWRIPASPKSGKGGTFVLVAAAPLDDVYREQHEAQEAMWIGIPIALLLAGAGGLWLATIGLRPITAMADRASRLAPTGLDDLGESGRQDE